MTVEDRSRFFDVTNKTKAVIQNSILNIIEVCIINIEIAYKSNANLIGFHYKNVT